MSRRTGTRSWPSRRRNGRARLLLALLLLAGLLLAARAAAAAEPIPAVTSGWWLQVRSAATASGPTVLLGDIAEPRGDLSGASWKELAAKPLWAAPARTGLQTAFSRERLQALLRQYLGDQAQACALPSQLVIQRGGAAIDGPRLTRMGVEYLTDKAQALRGEAEIVDVRVPDYVFLESPRDRLQLVMPEPLKPGRNNFLLEIQAADGKVARRYAVSALVHLWRMVPCAARPINRLEFLTPQMVTYKRRNLAYNENAWDGQGGPWRVARAVGTDQVITRDAIEPVPVIARGAKVNLVYEGTNIRLSVKAEALADAGVGQRLVVRNLQSDRKITGTVQDPETVVVR